VFAFASHICLSCVDISPDGSKILGCGHGFAVWDRQGTELFRVKGDKVDTLTNKIVRFTSDGRHIVGITRNRDYGRTQLSSLRFWSAETGTEGPSCALKPRGGFYRLANDLHPTPDGKRLLVGCADSLVREISLQDGRVLSTYKTGSSVSVWTDGLIVVAAGYPSNTVHVRDLSSQTTLFECDLGAQVRAVTSDGRFIAACGFGGKFGLWSYKDGKPLCMLTLGPKTKLESLHITQTTVLCGGSKRWYAIDIRDPGNSYQVAKLAGHARFFWGTHRSVASTPDGSFMVTANGDGNGLTFWSRSEADVGADTHIAKVQQRDSASANDRGRELATVYRIKRSTCVIL
jgi:WD40 repeat protein